MESIKEEIGEEQQVTVEVVPQAVTGIVYLQDSDLTCYTPDQDLEDDDDKSEDYEVGSVSAASLTNKLVLDATQSFVLLSPGSDFINANSFFNKVEGVEESYVEPDEDTVSGIGEFICTSCKFKCRSFSSLARHKLIHGDQFVKCHYNCVVCGLRFDKAQTLSHHFRMTHERSKLTCTICDRTYTHELALLQHLKRHDPNKFACDVCNAVFDNALKLVNHKKTHSTTLLYACNKCDASFSSTAEVSIHLRGAHPKSKVLFPDIPALHFLEHYPSTNNTNDNQNCSTNNEEVEDKDECLSTDNNLQITRKKRKIR